MSMMSIGEILKSSFEAMEAKEHMPLRNGDFTNEDGLVCCGICSHPRETRKMLYGKEMLFPCLCLCGQRERAELEEKLRLDRERQTVEELKRYSLVDERFRESIFENSIETDENAKALRIARNYVRHFDEMLASNTGLLFYGRPGTGKSFIAGCIANALIAKGIPVMVTSIVRMTTGVFDDELQVILKKMSSAQLLVLDDFGTERNTSTKMEQVFNVIDTRYNAKRPMVITTNVTNYRDEMDIRYRRVYDRIFECCHPVKMDGSSWRTKSSNDNYRHIAELLNGE